MLWLFQISILLTIIVFFIGFVLTLLSFRVSRCRFIWFIRFFVKKLLVFLKFFWFKITGHLRSLISSIRCWFSDCDLTSKSIEPFYYFLLWLVPWTQIAHLLVLMYLLVSKKDCKAHDFPQVSFCFKHLKLLFYCHWYFGFISCNPRV